MFWCKKETAVADCAREDPSLPNPASRKSHVGRALASLESDDWLDFTENHNGQNQARCSDVPSRSTALFPPVVSIAKCGSGRDRSVRGVFYSA